LTKEFDFNNLAKLLKSKVNEDDFKKEFYALNAKFVGLNDLFAALKEDLEHNNKNFKK
jgi:hypothetical protein